MTRPAMKKFPQLQGLAQYMLQGGYKMLCVLLGLCTDAALGLHLGIRLGKQQGVGEAQDPLQLSWSFSGEKDLSEVQRKMCSSVPRLWEEEGSGFHFRSLSSFFLRKETDPFRGSRCSQLVPGRYRPAARRLCSSSPSPAPPADGFVSLSPVSLLYFSPLHPRCCAWPSPASPWPRKIH